VSLVESLNSDRIELNKIETKESKMQKSISIARRVSSSFNGEAMTAYRMVLDRLAGKGIEVEDFISNYLSGDKYAATFIMFHTATKESLLREFEAVNALLGSKVKVASSRRASVIGTNMFGHRIGTQADDLDDLMINRGLSNVEINRIREYGKARVANHRAHLKSRGYL